jgi:hypothetical protein
LGTLRAPTVSPDPLDRVRIECRIGADNRHLFRDALGNDEPVEGIAMVPGQRYQGVGVFELDSPDYSLSCQNRTDS